MRTHLGPELVLVDKLRNSIEWHSRVEKMRMWRGYVKQFPNHYKIDIFKSEGSVTFVFKVMVKTFCRESISAKPDGSLNVSAGSVSLKEKWDWTVIDYLPMWRMDLR